MSRWNAFVAFNLSTTNKFISPLAAAGAILMLLGGVNCPVARALPNLPSGTLLTALSTEKVRIYGKVVNSFSDGSCEVKVEGYKKTARWSVSSVLWEVPFLEQDGTVLRKGSRVSGVSRTGDALVGKIGILWSDGSASIQWDGETGDLPYWGKGIFATPLTSPILSAKTAPAFEFPDEDFIPLRRALIKKQVGSFVVTGEAGSGKTELVRAFIRKVGEGAFEEIPKSQRFLYLDALTLQKDTNFRGDFETKLK